MTKKVALYVRVSTDGQTVTNQESELQAVAKRNGWQIVETFSDRGISGAKGRDKRPGYDALLKGIARRDFDLVASWSVDRLGRSLQDLVAFLEELKSKGVDLYLHQQGLDTATPAGRAMFGMLSVFAEFERGIIKERVNAGIARARKHGTKSGKLIGRPKTEVAPKVKAKIAALRKSGKGMNAIAREVGCSNRVVETVLSGGQS